MRFLSLFSGIEAASVAFEPIGGVSVAFSEIEPFPCAVLAHHYPNVPNLGDVTKITEGHIASLGPIDLVCFGSPCQDLSVAGKRKGLVDAATGDVTRSGLFFAAMRIFKWANKHCGARFALWENVAGAYSSNKGEDFAAVVAEMAGLENVRTPENGWGSEGCAVGDNGMLEWACMDAQWFGVAQRRRRVFAVLDTGDWANRPPLLLEPDSLRRDTAPSREAGESVAGTFKACASSGGWSNSADHAAAGYMQPVGCWWDGGQVSQTLDAVLSKGQTMPEKNRFPAVLQPTVAFPANLSGTQCASTENLSQSLVAKNPTAVAFQSSQSGIRLSDTHATLDANNGPRRHNGVMTTVATFQQSSMKGKGTIGYDESGVAKPVKTQSDGQMVAFTVGNLARGAGPSPSSETFPTLTVSKGCGISDQQPSVMTSSFAVRRLTPTECERLQGFPDNWTLIPWRKKPAEECPDGPRYKALGNSWAVPNVRWIGARIQAEISK